MPRASAGSGAHSYAEHMAHMRKTGTRAELVTELQQDTGYWSMVGNLANLAAAIDGARALEAGAERVTVGHTVYEPSD